MRSEGEVDTADDYRVAPTALVVADRVSDARAASAALTAAGVRVAAQFGFAAAVDRLGTQAITDLIVIEASDVAPALFEPVLERANALAGTCRTAVIVTLDEAWIDIASALLTNGNIQLLCRPTRGDRVCAVALAKGHAPGRLRDAARDTDTARLERLNEEVARIAEELARLARDGDTLGNALREPEYAYRAFDEGGVEISPAEIRATIRARRMRNQYFAGELFADPAWDMLLDLFAAALERRQVSVSSLCIAAAVPPTTALRWIGALHDSGLFAREADPADRRRAYVLLSSKGIDGMRAYAAALKRAGLPLV